MLMARKIGKRLLALEQGLGCHTPFEVNRIDNLAQFGFRVRRAHHFEDLQRFIRFIFVTSQRELRGIP